MPPESVGLSGGFNGNTGEVKSGQFLLPEAFTQYILKFRDSDIWPAAEVELAYLLIWSRSSGAPFLTICPASVMTMTRTFP